MDTFESEKEENLKAVQKEIDDLEKQLTGVRTRMSGDLKELNLA